VLEHLYITCEHCGKTVGRKREAQRYCSKRCRDTEAKRQERKILFAPATCSPGSTAFSRALDRPPEVTVRNWDGPPLQGDDHPLRIL
jgi:hypothetical protein